MGRIYHSCTAAKRTYKKQVVNPFYGGTTETDVDNLHAGRQAFLTAVFSLYDYSKYL